MLKNDPAIFLTREGAIRAACRAKAAGYRLLNTMHRCADKSVNLGFRVALLNAGGAVVGFIGEPSNA
jgi:hypothetical protein